MAAPLQKEGAMCLASLTIVAGLFAKLVAVNKYNLSFWWVLVIILAIDLLVAGVYQLTKG